MFSGAIRMASFWAPLQITRGCCPGSALIDGNEVSLTLLIDERGRVQDFYLSGGELTDEMKSLILFSQFAPATVSGQPTWGLKQVVFTRSHRLRS